MIVVPPSQVRGERYREALPGVRQVDVLSSVGIAPTHAEHVAVGEERVRADEHPARAEKTVVGEPAQDGEVPRQDLRAAERARGARERPQRRRGRGMALALDQPPHGRPVETEEHPLNSSHRT